MSTTWYCIPSARPGGGSASNWRERGYKVALWVDPGIEVEADLVIAAPYPGYALAVNTLCREVLKREPETQWLVTGGDDITPDPTHTPEEIAAECTEHFGGTFGVMQPTADRWGERPDMPNLHPLRTAYIDRVCGSPWMGADFCRRMYGGTGPLWSGWYHMRVDEEMQEVAKDMGVLWQRPDLLHEHNHWARRGAPSVTKHCPTFLLDVSGPKHWAETTRLFEERKAAGFPGHGPLKG